MSNPFVPVLIIGLNKIKKAKPCFDTIYWTSFNKPQRGPQQCGTPLCYAGLCIANYLEIWVRGMAKKWLFKCDTIHAAYLFYWNVNYPSVSNNIYQTRLWIFYWIDCICVINKQRILRKFTRQCTFKSTLT